MATTATTKTRRKRQQQISFVSPDQQKQYNFCSPSTRAHLGGGSGLGQLKLDEESRLEASISAPTVFVKVGEMKREEDKAKMNISYFGVKEEEEEKEKPSSFHLSAKLENMGGVQQQTGGFSNNHNSSPLIMPLLLLIVSSSIVYCAPIGNEQKQRHQQRHQPANQLQTTQNTVPLAGTSEKFPTTSPLIKFPSLQLNKQQTGDDKQATVVQPTAEEELETLLLAIVEEQQDEESTSLRRLIKRSGISDQRLAEIQMIRALKKQLERASKLAASNSNSAGQEVSTN